jgi:Ca-activated chloride channel homolog
MSSSGRRALSGGVACTMALAMATTAFCQVLQIQASHLQASNANSATSNTPNFKVDVRLVRLLVTVKTAAGDLLGSLERSDFAIFDNGVKQELSVFERQTPQPLSITLLIDTSLSTGKDLKVETTSIQRFLQTLIREGNPSDAASLYSFSAEVTMLNSFTRNLSRLEDSLRMVRPDSGTSFHDAIYLSTRELRERNGRHVIVTVTDGGDTTSKKKYRDAVEAAQRADAVFYPIVIVPITNPAGRNTGGEHALETLAQLTGGRTFYPSVGSQLDDTFSQILRDLRTQYFMGYYPRGVSVGVGAFHTVRVEIPGRSDLRISARTGYYEDNSP